MVVSPRNESYVRKCARELLSSLPSLSCPVPLEPFAKARGINRVTLIKLESDGFLFNDGTNLIIYVNSQLSEPRRRFTCAHEIGHTYFRKSALSEMSPTRGEACSECRTEFADYSKEEEYLCDIFAVELLMPRALTERIVNENGISFRCIRRLSSAFHVSLSAAAWRMVELAKESVGILWFKRMSKPTDPSDIKLRLDWGVFPKSHRMYLPRFDAVSSDSLISKCFLSRQTLEGYEKLDFGSLRGTQYLVCKYFQSSSLGNSVLCLVFPDAPPNSRQSPYPMSFPEF